MVIIRSGVLPSWLGWAGLVVAAAELVGAASFGQAGLFRPQGDLVAVQAGANGLLLWLLATSVIMLRPPVTRLRYEASDRRCRTQAFQLTSCASEPSVRQMKEAGRSVRATTFSPVHSHRLESVEDAAVLLIVAAAPSS